MPCFKFELAKSLVLSLTRPNPLFYNFGARAGQIPCFVYTLFRPVYRLFRLMHY